MSDHKRAPQAGQPQQLSSCVAAHLLVPVLPLLPSSPSPSAAGSAGAGGRLPGRIWMRRPWKMEPSSSAIDRGVAARGKSQPGRVWIRRGWRVDPSSSAEPAMVHAHLCSHRGSRGLPSRCPSQAKQLAHSGRPQACKPSASIDNQHKVRWPTCVSLDRILRVAELHQSESLALLAGPAE